jgi:maleate cis-trans isomerase
MCATTTKPCKQDPQRALKVLATGKKCNHKNMSATPAPRARAALNYGQTARLGLIVPPGNSVNEAEWALALRGIDGITLHVTRMALHTDTVSEAGQRALYADIEHAARDLAAASVDVIAYGCTAGSMVLPLDAITSHITRVTGVPAVATAPSIVHALRALKVSRVALATPYHDALNAHEREFLAACGIEVVSLRGLGIGASGPADYVRIPRVALVDAHAHAHATDVPEAQALVISCTGLATLGFVDELAQNLGKPVITSNSATLWAALWTALRDVHAQDDSVLSTVLSTVLSSATSSALSSALTLDDKIVGLSSLASARP